MSAVAKLAGPSAAAVHEVDLDELVQRLGGENQALQAVLYGLCMGLSHMGDVHREVVAQAFEYAFSAPRTDAAAFGEQGANVRNQAFRDAVAGLKDAVTSRFR